MLLNTVASIGLNWQSLRSHGEAKASFASKFARPDNLAKGPIGVLERLSRLYLKVGISCHSLDTFVFAVRVYAEVLSP